MIERYSRKVMRDVWTEENKFAAYLKVEILSCEAWSRLGVIPAEDVEKIRANAGFSVDRIKEIEEQTRHDVVAFTRAVSETLGEEKKWVHYGLTSTDVVDTANGYLLNAWINGKGVPEDQSMKITALKNPSSKILIAETWRQSGGNPPLNLEEGHYRFTLSVPEDTSIYRGRPAGRHSRNCNVLFGDMHVGRFTLDNPLDPYSCEPFMSTLTMNTRRHNRWWE